MFPLSGVFAATLSSALASMVGAPRILQSVAADNIFPWRALAFFGEGRGVQNEPVRAYFLTFVLATACVLIGELDQVRGGEEERRYKPILMSISNEDATQVIGQLLERGRREAGEMGGEYHGTRVLCLIRRVVSYYSLPLAPPFSHTQTVQTHTHTHCILTTHHHTPHTDRPDYIQFFYDLLWPG